MWALTPAPTQTRLGSYAVLAPLGAGGMGEVYRARDTRLERDVAIKVLPHAGQLAFARALGGSDVFVMPLTASYAPAGEPRG